MRLQSPRYSDGGHPAPLITRTNGGENGVHAETLRRTATGGAGLPGGAG